MGAEVWSAAIAQLGDKSGRRDARFRALCSDLFIGGNGVWRTAKRVKSANDHSIGGYSIPTNKNGTRLISRRHVLTVCWHLKQLLDASDDAALKRAEETVALDWGVPKSQLGLTATPFGSQQAFNNPFYLWNGEWEKQADALRK